MQLAIHNALNSHLKDYVDLNGGAVAWEGVNYTPAAGIPYLKAFCLPGSVVPKGLGQDGFLQCSGIFQIDCVFPLGGGHGPAKTKAEDVASWFRRGLQLIADDPNLRIRQSQVGPGIPDGGWYTVPVTVNWIAYS